MVMIHIFGGCIFHAWEVTIMALILPYNAEKRLNCLSQVWTIVSNMPKIDVLRKRTFLFLKMVSCTHRNSSVEIAKKSY